MTEHFAGQRVTVMGLGTRGGGLGVARYLASHGAIVTVTDLRTEEQLAAPMAELAGLPIRYVLGRHEDRDFTTEGADILVRNPGVRRFSPYLKLARKSGVRVEMEMSLFLRACPAPVVGITGTKGKTTTSTLCGLMLSAWNPDTVVAGNMGVSALDQLDRITPETPVVLEISSWQVEAMDEQGLSPAIAVLTNISEDHLDTYDSFDHYADTKRAIAHHQQPGDVFVVNADDPQCWRGASETRGEVVGFGLGECDLTGVWVTDDALVIRRGDERQAISWPSGWASAGTHMQLNAAAAAGAACWRGASIAAIAEGLSRFNGVKDRNELVAEIDGVRFVNDTAATAPAAAVAALRSYAGTPVYLIVGGSDKRLDLTPLADAAATAEHVYLLDGAATPALTELLGARGVDPSGPFTSMAAAVEAAAESATSGSVVLLSPGCASFGLFRDEFDRGEQFRQAVRAVHMKRVAR